MTHPTLEKIPTEQAIEHLIRALNCMATYGLEHPEYLAACDLAYQVFPPDQESESDQLRARIAALEAEVARLKEPVALVWQSDEDGGRIYSQTINGHWYELHLTSVGFLPAFCNAHMKDAISSPNFRTFAIAACAAHHLARYREMQGAS